MQVTFLEARNEFLKLCPKWEHIWGSDTYCLLTQADLDWFRIPRSTRLLDYGCGSGFLTYALRRWWYTVDCYGYDSLAWGERESTWLKADIPCYCAVPPMRFDNVMMHACIEHCADPDAELRRVHAMLPEGGRLYIARCPEKWSWAEFVARHVLRWGTSHDTRYTWRSIEELLTRNGFVVERHERTDFVTAYPARFTNKMVRPLLALNWLMLHSPLRVFAHHHRLVAVKRGGAE